MIVVCHLVDVTDPMYLPIIRTVSVRPVASNTGSVVRSEQTTIQEMTQMGGEKYKLVPHPPGETGPKPTLTAEQFRTHFTEAHRDRLLDVMNQSWRAMKADLLAQGKTEDEAYHTTHAFHAPFREALGLIWNLHPAPYKW